jgi:hypothetical protein
MVAGVVTSGVFRVLKQTEDRGAFRLSILCMRVRLWRSAPRHTFNDETYGTVRCTNTEVLDVVR